MFVCSSHRPVWSDYTVEGECRLLPEAPDNIKERFEAFFNTSYDFKINHPEMRNPYYTWEGKIIDKPLTPEEEEEEEKQKKKEEFMKKYSEWLRKKEKDG